MLGAGKIQHYIDAYPVTSLTSKPSIFDTAIAPGYYDFCSSRSLAPPRSCR
jgi:transaldolase